MCVCLCVCFHVLMGWLCIRVRPFDGGWCVCAHMKAGVWYCVLPWDGGWYVYVCDACVII